MSRPRRNARKARGIGRGRRNVVATYDYRDQHGKLAYQLARYLPKDFAFLTPGGRPWPSAVRRRRLLYRLPDLMAAGPNPPVYIVEGEKDVDRLWSIGLVATCNDGGGGRGKWSPAHSRHLKGRSVIIIPDNDPTGNQHADDVAHRLRRVAGELRIVRLPGVPNKGDVSDWLGSGGTAEELMRLCSVTPLWKYEAPKPAACRDYNEMYSAALRRETIIVSAYSALEKLLLIILSDLRERESPSQEVLAKYLGVTERRIRQLIRQLRAGGVVQVTRFRRRNSYSVQLR